MAKVGRFITDPKAGAYCQIDLDSGDKILVNHDKGGFKGGRLTVMQKKFFGGQTLLDVDLDGAAGKALMARLTQGAAEGSTLATPLGAVVEALKNCASLDAVRAACARIQQAG